MISVTAWIHLMSLEQMPALAEGNSLAVSFLKQVYVVKVMPVTCASSGSEKGYIRFKQQIELFWIFFRLVIFLNAPPPPPTTTTLSPPTTATLPCFTRAVKLNASQNKCL
jgi:hypothetical protein